MVCKSYTLDLSAIERELKKLKDSEIQKQIKRKFERLIEDPFIGETKKYKLKNEYVIKIHRQRIVIFYHIDDDNCIVLFDRIEEHDKGYKDTF